MIEKKRQNGKKKNKLKDRVGLNFILHDEFLIENNLLIY